MGKLFCLIVVLFFALSNGQKATNTPSSFSHHKDSLDLPVEKNATYQSCWRGKLDGKTDMLLHYQVQEDLIVGYVIHGGAKEKKRIRIIGTQEANQKYRLLEFDQTGNISGILTGLPQGKAFTGTWFSPATLKAQSFHLSQMDTLIKLEPTKTNSNNITGTYTYQYTSEGYQGVLAVAKAGRKKISLAIHAVTEAPARNTADFEAEIPAATTDFVYKFPDSDNCAFRVRFFKDFVYVNYIKGYCEGRFGHNATIDGVFYKEK